MTQQGDYGFGPNAQNPRGQLPAMPPQFQGRRAPQQDYPPTGQPQFQPARQPAPQQWPTREASDYARPQALAAQPLRKTSLTAAEQFWYVLMNIGFGAGYFAKIPGKKALNDFGMVEMTAAEKFWYVMMCIPMGAGYFAKVPVAKAITEMQRR
jgi:hypothetical protein